MDDLTLREHNALLRIWADAVDDTEDSRKRAQNQLRALRDVKRLGGSKAELELALRFERLKVEEKRAVRELEKAMRVHPFGVWVLDPQQKGVGLKTAARFLAAILDPCSRVDRETGEILPRTVAQLRQYCGHGARSRRKRGVVVDHNPEAKKRLYLIAKSCIYKNGHWRDVYDQAKADAEGKVHTTECQNSVRPVAGAPAGSNGCGTRQYPEWGEIGSPWRPGHIHAHALRIVGKEILADLHAFATGLEGSGSVEVAA